MTPWKRTAHQPPPDPWLSRATATSGSRRQEPNRTGWSPVLLASGLPSPIPAGTAVLSQGLAHRIGAPCRQP
jgi:hypothetical protein